MRIVLTGGGTGGHIFPLVAVAEKIKERAPGDVEFLYIGSGATMEKEVMEKEGISVKNVKSGKIRRYFSPLNFVDFFKIPVGIIQSLWILLKFMPDAVFSKGGYAAVPVVIAAWFYRIPVLVHESDAVAGLANRFSSKFARRVAVSYPSAKAYFLEGKTAVLGIPVRKSIVGGDASAARSRFGLLESKPTILVMGGSQGARVINESIVKILPELLRKTQIIHQTGNLNYENVIHQAAEYGIKAGRDGYIAVPFLDSENLRDAFAVSELVISRAGANSVAEIAANKKPAILIPLDTAANNHQRANALELAKNGGAIVLEEANLRNHMLMQSIDSVLDSKERAQEMSEKIGAFYHENADEAIANGILGMI